MAIVKKKKKVLVILVITWISLSATQLDENKLRFYFPCFIPL